MHASFFYAIIVLCKIGKENRNWFSEHTQRKRIVWNNAKDRFLTFCLLINTLLSKVIGADLCKYKQEDKITENQRSRESKDMQDNRSAAHGGGRCKFLVASL